MCLVHLACSMHYIYSMKSIRIYSTLIAYCVENSIPELNIDIGWENGF
jgi:hypothetical protein